jgi:hypothetical protein
LVKNNPHVFGGGYPSLGFDLPLGWVNLVESLVEAIERRIKSNRHIPDIPKKIIVLQIKEKFGGLRFYIGGADDHTYGMIYMVEMMSYNMCQFCGKKGKLYSDWGWYRTLCESCHEEYVQERIKQGWKVRIDDRNVD